MEEIRATFWDHLEQLRRALLMALAVALLGMVVCLLFHKQLFALLEAPIVKLVDISTTHFPDNQGVKELSPLIILSPMEGMSLLFKLSFWCGLTATSPAWLYILLRFAAAGMTFREKRLILPFLTLTVLFFSTGILFAYGVTLPIANGFLYRLNASLAVNLWSLGSYIDYSLLLLIAHGILFEGFVVLLFLVHLGIVSPDRLSRHRRLAIVLLFILAALLTPPDVVTQCLLALPAVGLYEAMILYGRLRNGKTAVPRGTRSSL